MVFFYGYLSLLVCVIFNVVFLHPIVLVLALQTRMDRCPGLDVDGLGGFTSAKDGLQLFPRISSLFNAFKLKKKILYLSFYYIWHLPTASAEMLFSVKG